MMRRLPTAFLTVLLSILLVAPAMGQGLIIIDRPIPVPPTPPDMTIIRPTPLPGAEPTTHCLQLKQHQVTVSIKDQVATTRIEHVFHNPTGQRLEGRFIFPLPGSANIDTFEMDVNGKMTEAELLDADKARKIYEDIVRSMRDPALLEYAEHGLLKARVFPIEPNSDKRVTLEYTELLEADSGTASYTYPLAARTVQNAQIGRLALKLTLETERPLANVYCPTHAVEIKRRGEHKAMIGYESDRLGDDDLKVYFSAEKPDGPVGLTMLAHRDGHADVLGSKDGYFMLLASPMQAGQRKPTPKDVVFVLDTSGSMQGEKLKQAKKALKFCIENLNDADRFQIVRFSTDAETLFDSLKPADKEHRGKANDFVDGLKPIGGTAIEEALSKAVEPVVGDHIGGGLINPRPRYVIFLTDGRPTIGETDTDRIIHNAITRFKAENKVRVFCFGIGTDINTKLLDKITETTRAVTEYVLPDEDIEIKVSRFYTKISEPVLANPRLTVTGDIKLVKTYPKDLPDLFAGDQLVVIGRYTGDGDAAVKLTGTVGGDGLSIVDDASFAKQSIEHAFIPRLWATRRIGYLLDEIRLRGENSELQEEVVALARAFGVVTPYTSYLIVEDEARRDVPMAARTLQEIDRDGARRTRAGDAYRQMAQSEAGAASVRGAQSNRALKSAASAPAAEAANDYAKLGADALATDPTAEGRRLDADKLTQPSLHRHGKTFVRNGAQWVDTEAQTERAQQMKVERVAFNSDRYFEIVREHKDTARWLSVGQNVQLVLADRVVEVYEQ